MAIKNNSIEKQLENEIPSSIKNDFENEIPKSKIYADDIIKNVNNQFLMKILSPEISKNELAKRLHKYLLLGLLTISMLLQFVAAFVISIKIVDYSISTNANVDIVKCLLTFISAYITSIVVELIAILNYIVKNVFDTSLTDLVKIFKDT